MLTTSLTPFFFQTNITLSSSPLANNSAEGDHLTTLTAL